MNADEESTFDPERKDSTKNTDGQSPDITQDDFSDVPPESSIPVGGVSANYGRYISNEPTDHAPVTSRNARAGRSANYGSYLNRSRAIGDEERATRTAIEQRRPQMFPRLGVADVERTRRFGALESWKAGETMFRAGEKGLGIRVILRGNVLLTRRDGLGQSRFLAELAEGQFLGETAQLTGKPYLVDGYALKDVDAILISPAQVRALLIEEAQLGEIIMRALILRRAELVQGGSGPVLIGPATDTKTLALEGFFRRVNHPYRVVDTESDAETVGVLSKLPDWRESTPIVVLADGTILRRPDEATLADRLGLLPELAPTSIYDVAIVGAGPAGLAAAVYAASEGLSVIVFDSHGAGGQAAASARLENYLGFPAGISGHALAYRAFMQAVKFGAEISIPSEISKLDCAVSPFRVHLTGGRLVSAHSVVVASGASYRRPDIDGLDLSTAKGVYYWASSVEAKLCQGTEVVLVGGGNSAGQAIVYLSNYASHVHVLVRRGGLEESMSRYLIDRVMALHNVTIHTRTTIESASSDEDGLCGLTVNTEGRNASIETRHLFLFTGADPNTQWLRNCEVEVDDRGFVLTRAAESSDSSRCLTFQTNVPGIFAIGDVRSSSIKRVSAAVGEGAAVVSEIHLMLAQTRAC
ncbi:cyclic nucleotide-binding domain-containing protein [Trinickia violacea]|uniref:Cyclic nucleotide-binding domain-containing protein n=1 Tax=Trinickia violacea TaxID=2571746 RepID=A0A4P8IZ01_9BURK|nr:FAD-dependent oxidoreductase [Trinickia violacea]QCP52803.1 cyclic nucleotide-binding domain-containing protein [Trinickia violacea]